MGRRSYEVPAGDPVVYQLFEELSVCVRWVGESGVREHFLGLVPLSSCNAETITRKLVEFMKKKGIDSKKMRGQGYDGASTMSSKTNWVQNRIRIMCSPKALYVHYRAHLLQLALVQSADSIPVMKSVINTMMAIWKTFHFSPNKTDRLVEMQKVLDHPVMKMIKPSDTRWAAYQRCVTAVMKSLHPLVATFDHLYIETGMYFDYNLFFYV